MKKNALYEHHRGLTDASVIRTPHVRRIGEAISDVCEVGGIAVVHGNAGMGKTFGVGTNLVAAAKKVEVTRIVTSIRPTETRLLKQVMTACVGAAPEGTAYELYDEAGRELGRVPRILVVDEAQNMSLVGIECLRQLHDQSNFALLLVGGNKCWEVLSGYPMLRSRVDQRVHVEPLSDEEILRYIPQYHPIYEDIDRELILLVNDALGRGCFRRWASFTRKAQTVCGKAGEDRLTEQIAKQVFVTEAGGES